MPCLYISAVQARRCSEMVHYNCRGMDDERDHFSHEGSGYPTGHVGAGLLLGVGGDVLHPEGQRAPLQGTPYLPRRSTHRPRECSVHSESLLVPRQRLVYRLH